MDDARGLRVPHDYRTLVELDMGMDSVTSWAVIHKAGQRAFRP